MDKPVPEDAKLAELTDKVVEVSLALRPLCHDAAGLPSEARRVVRQVCEILSSVSNELIDILRPPGNFN